MPSTLDKSPDRPEGAPEATGGDLVKQLLDHAELLKKMDEVTKPRQITSPSQKLMRRAAREIERLNGIYLSAVKGRQDFRAAMRDWKQRVEAAEAELERTQAILTEVWVAATRARNALHAHNRPRFPAKLRTEVRDILDKALENSNG